MLASCSNPETTLVHSTLSGRDVSLNTIDTSYNLRNGWWMFVFPFKLQTIQPAGDMLRPRRRKLGWIGMDESGTPRRIDPGRTGKGSHGWPQMFLGCYEPPLGCHGSCCAFKSVREQLVILPQTTRGPTNHPELASRIGTPLPFASSRSREGTFSFGTFLLAPDYMSCS